MNTGAVPGRAHRKSGSKRVRFDALMAAGIVVIGSVFEIIRHLVTNSS
ncbi:MAG: hypothetical protein ABIO14_11200 [Aeromicrobium sp.]